MIAGSVMRSNQPVWFRSFLVLAAAGMLFRCIPALAVLAGVAWVLAWAGKSRNWIFACSLCLGWLVCLAALPVLSGAAQAVLGAVLPAVPAEGPKVAGRLALLPWMLMLLFFSSIGGRPLPAPRRGNLAAPVLAPFLVWGKPMPAWRYTAIGLAVACLAWVPAMDFQPGLLVWSLGFALVNAPLEEILWRGLVQAGLGRIFRPGEAILWTSLLFGASHALAGFDWPACLALGAGGLVFGGLARATRGITLPVAFHGVLNVCFGLGGLLFGRG